MITFILSIFIIILIPFLLTFLGIWVGLRVSGTKPNNFREILLFLWGLSYITQIIGLLMIMLAWAIAAYAPFKPMPAPLLLFILAPLLPFITSFFMNRLALNKVLDFEKTKSKSVAISLSIFTHAGLLFIIMMFLVYIVDPGDFNHGGGRCVGNPINEIATATSQAMSGIERGTSSICLQEGESFTSEAITNKVASLRTMSFECYQSSAICSGNNAPIEVTSNGLIAIQRAQFSMLISCDKLSSGDYDCLAKVRPHY